MPRSTKAITVRGLPELVCSSLALIAKEALEGDVVVMICFRLN
jgi:hypothetical protein